MTEQVQPLILRITLSQEFDEENDLTATWYQDVTVSPGPPPCILGVRTPFVIKERLPEYGGPVIYLNEVLRQ